MRRMRVLKIVRIINDYLSLRRKSINLHTRARKLINYKIIVPGIAKKYHYGYLLHLKYSYVILIMQITLILRRKLNW